MNQQPLRAFTLVELLVVMAVIAVLVSSVMVASSSVVTSAKVRNTSAVLVIVQEAIEQFHREQTAKPTVTRKASYRKRYGAWPPDELEPFTKKGILGKGKAASIVRSGEVVPAPAAVAYGAMRFYTDGDPDKDLFEHRDIAGMILAIELYSDEASAILSRLPDRNRIDGPRDAAGNPSQFFNRANSATPGGWDTDDLAIRYIVDDWGVPITYLAQRDWDKKTPAATESSNHPGWNEASTELIRINNGRPILMSYGPDGKEQLTTEFMDAGADDGGTASIVGDWDAGRDIDHPANEDNVYANPELKKRLAKSGAS